MGTVEEIKDSLPIQKDGKFCYSIVYRDDLKDLAGALDGVENGGWKQIAIITDSNVAPLYAEEVKAQLLSGGRSPEIGVCTLPAGEDHKTLDSIEAIYRYLLENHYDRSCLLIALGGGVIGDMTGFAAATWLRGVDFIQIPTTLLAQADSSIGGKTGVDFNGYKNMVGAFYMPRLVYSCVSVLRSLSAPQFSGGFAEIMKHGLIRDGVFYEWLLDHIYEINGRDPDTLKEMLYRSNLIKKNVVEKDPFEKNERRLLNFGHTIGHAIEKYRNFELSHGECVALGCVAASYISWKKGYLSMDEYYEIRDMFVPYGLPISVENIDIPEVCRLVHSDKKVSAGTLHFVLLKKAGKAFIDTTVTDEEIEDALKEIQYTEDGE